MHRDIKPANLLIEPGGRVKLTDFGVARIQDSGEATRTQGSMVGTLKYMAPEQVQGQKIDSRADLFSVGVVLYQLLTDKRPFDGDNDFSIIHQIIGHTPAAAEFVQRAAAARPSTPWWRGRWPRTATQRFATARDFAVGACSRRSAAPRTPPWCRPPIRSRRRTPAAPGSKAGQPSMTGAGNSRDQRLPRSRRNWSWSTGRTSRTRSIPRNSKASWSKFPGGHLCGPGTPAAAQARGRQFARSDGPERHGQPAARQDMEATRLRTGTVPLVVAAPADRPSAPAEEPQDARAHRPCRPPSRRSPPEEPAGCLGAAATADDFTRRHRAASCPGQSLPSWPRRRLEDGAGPQRAAHCTVRAQEAARLPCWRGVGRRGGGGHRRRLSSVEATQAPPGRGPRGWGRRGLSVRARGSRQARGGPWRPATAPVGGRGATPAPRPPAAPLRRRPVRRRRPASRPWRRAGCSAPPSNRPSAPGPEPPRAASPPPQPRPSAPPTPRGACKDKMFLSKELCLAEHCDKAGARNHPLCVKRREEARLREESKVRN